MGVTPFHLECRVGRLVELRPEGLRSVGDLSAIFSAIGQLRRAAPGPAIFCVDWRLLRVLSPDVAELLANSMREGNTHTLRSAALMGQRAMLGLQLDRVIRESNHPSRRIFRDPAAMLAWLGEVTTPEEQARATDFIASIELPGSEPPLSRLPARARPGS